MCAEKALNYLECNHECQKQCHINDAEDGHIFAINCKKEQRKNDNPNPNFH